MTDLLRLLGLFKPFRRSLAAGIALSTGVILANVALLSLAGWFITAMALAGLGGYTINYFTPAAGIRALAIVRSVGRYGERLVTHDATLRLLSQLRGWFYVHLEPLAPARLQFYRGGDLLSRIRADIDTLDNFYLRVLVPTVAAAVSVLVMVGFLAGFSVAAALIDLAGLVVVGIGMPLLVQRLGAVPGARAVAGRADLRSAIADSVRGMDELHVYQARVRQAGHVERLSQGLVAPQRRQVWIDAVAGAVSGLATRLCLWLALVAVIPLIAAGRLDGADLAMIAFFILASFEAVNPLPLAFRSLGETRAAARRIFALVDAAPAVDEPPREAEPPPIFDIRCRGLRMRYAEGARWALDGIDLHVAPGQRLGVVGATGSGKTSLFNVLLRFWDYQDGEATLGGVPLRAYRGETVRGWCAVVSQRTHLFNTSIRENLRLAHSGATDEQLWGALRQAGIEAEIRALPGGLDTVTGETGTRLSGGQARRIAIARALLKDAPILLLDEPTEGLDAGTEHAVLQALETLMANRTTLLITHRPQALRHVDRVAVLGDGRVLEQGTPGELLRRGRYLPIYAALG
ncbi:thiol reductant ABC exporter subunit CydC [Salinisphaera sp.]|uniref:thiol reductant ABC exporter subunit CydC n=1 Tax=Salinisphaera sp. TaxID=1914330 RepID=UPI002D79FF3F|nr:thiol reductant ABC exporter subunit CydC [Salinisphaera sp.]HET7314284.1 thiol reductant ABC exporter subunit CydC [Salinisphaera sp.]